MTVISDTATRWEYWASPLEEKAASFGVYAAMVELWRARIPPGDLLPPRPCFDFLDFRGWWGRVAVAQIERDPFDVRFSLWGTKLTEWWGVDYTNRRLGEASKNPEVWRHTEGRYFAAMAERPFIGVASGRLDQHDRSFKKVVSLDLPLGKGRTLTHVMAVHMEIDLMLSASDILPNCRMSKVHNS